MKRLRWAGATATLAALAGGMALGAWRAAPQTGFSWEGRAGQKLEVAGVCSISESNLECWSPHGKSDPDLSLLMRRLLSAKDAPNVPFRYGCKTRYLILRTVGDFSTISESPAGTTLTQITLPDDRGAHYQMVRVSPGDGDTETSVRCRISKPDLDLDLRCRAGAKGEIGGMAVLVGPIGKLDPEDAAPMAVTGVPSAWWSIRVSTTSGDSTACHYTLTPLDSARRPIRFVDPSGKPVKSDPKSAAGAVPPGVVAFTWWWLPGVDGVPNAADWYSCANPAYIAYLKVTKLEYQPIMLEHIPLDSRR